MTGRRLVGRWLVALSDPLGPSAQTPGRPLKPEDFARLRRRADRHGVLPALAANLRAFAREQGTDALVRGDGRAVVQALLDEVEARRVQYCGFALLLRSQLREIRRQLASSGVPAVVLKGAQFCDRLYPRPELRPFTDIDLLVPKAMVPAAGDALENLGYVPQPAPPRKHAGGYGEATWSRPGAPGGNVEIHWDLVNSPPLRRRVSVSFGDLDLSRDAQPTPSALLLIAAVHVAAGHRFDRLLPLWDVAQAARGAAGEVDAARLGDALRRTGATTAVGAALHLAAATLAVRECRTLAAKLASRPGPLTRWLLTPSVTVDPLTRISKLRRQMFREVLKRR